MRKLAIPQDYEPGSSEEADELRVIADGAGRLGRGRLEAA